MRIPQIASVTKAVEIYCNNITLGNKQIKELFGGISGNKISQLKKAAREQMEKDGAPAYNGYTVSTICAFKAWGLDIKELYKRYRTIQKLKIKEVAK